MVMPFACPSAWQSSARLTPVPLVPAMTLPQQELLPLKFSPVDPSLLLHPLPMGCVKGCMVAGSVGQDGTCQLVGATLTKTGQEL